MRILGFSEKWPKLSNQTFTTFRFERKDTDWQVGEVVQVVYKPRRKGGGEKLGVAKIISKEKRWVGWLDWHPQWLEVANLSYDEATEDGFESWLNMVKWMIEHHKGQNNREPMNKLSVTWISNQWVKE